MTAQFYVVGSFFVRSRNLFVAVGDIVEGYVEPGMSVVVDLGNIKIGTSVTSEEVIDVTYLGKASRASHSASKIPKSLASGRCSTCRTRRYSKST